MSSKLTFKQKQQIVKDLGIRCPVRRWQVRKDGSVIVNTRSGAYNWTPEPPAKPEPEPKAEPKPKPKRKVEQSGA